MSFSELNLTGIEVDRVDVAVDRHVTVLVLDVDGLTADAGRCRSPDRREVRSAPRRHQSDNHCGFVQPLEWRSVQLRSLGEEPLCLETSSTSFSSS